MPYSATSHLGIEVRSYETAIRRFIPGYEEMLLIAAREVVRDGPGLVLDLGAGTGALASAILDASPEVAVQLIDIDRDMLALARARLAARVSRAQFSAQSFLAGLPACDAVASSLALHHIRAFDEKRALYRGICQALPAGGTFVNADSVMPAEAQGRRAVIRSWVGHMAREGIRERDAYGHLEQWAQEDTYFPLERELAALEAVGFDARSVWSRDPINVIVARKRA